MSRTIGHNAHAKNKGKECWSARPFNPCATNKYHKRRTHKAERRITRYGPTPILEGVDETGRARINLDALIDRMERCDTAADRIALSDELYGPDVSPHSPKEGQGSGPHRDVLS